jgi:DNA-directed RNA polymerase subunit RPC12/RpoP
MATNQKLSRERIGAILHKHNKQAFKIAKDDGISFDDLTERTKPIATCETCGKPLELDLWQQLVCGYCGGWRLSNEPPKQA